MDAKIKIGLTSNGKLCLYSDSNDWREGEAYDTIKKEIIYYNGDYGDLRPTQIKQLVARPEEIGWVKHGGFYATELVRIEEMITQIKQHIEKNLDDCIVFEEKIKEQYVIQLKQMI